MAKRTWGLAVIRRAVPQDAAALAAVALHLVEAAEQGATKAILFAANRAGVRAYEKIGFQHLGAYRVAGLKSPMDVALERGDRFMGKIKRAVT